MISRFGLLGLVLAIGCDQAPQKDSPFRSMEAIVQTTKKWLGIENTSTELEAVDLSALDRHQDRLRRRMNLTRSEGVVQTHLRSQLRRQIGQEQFTKGIHVGAIVLWSKERPEKAIGIAIYSRDGLGWKGSPCDHLRVKMAGEQGFDDLLGELE